MGGDSLTDFLRQLPIQFLLLPVFFGVLYVGLTVFIIRRSAARRRRQRAAAAGQQVAPPTPARVKLPFGDFLRGQLPDKPVQPAEWATSSQLRNMPLPDLDMLTTPFDQNLPVSEPVSTEPERSTPDAAPDTAIVTNQPDWITAVVPVQEESSAMVPTNTDKNEPGNIQIGDAVEVMRIWRDLSDGKLIIQLGSQYYRTLNDIPHPDLVRRCVAVIRELWTMVNNLPARSTGAQISTGESGPVVPSLESAAGAPKPRIGLLNQEPDTPKPNFFKAAIGQKVTPAAPEQPAGIAGSVEDFLQFKLSSTPQLAARSIHIRPAHDQGVRIEVDGHYYDAIGDVVDPDVRDFLFTIMREWEARH